LTQISVTVSISEAGNGRLGTVTGGLKVSRHIQAVQWVEHIIKISFNISAAKPFLFFFHSFHNKKIHQTTKKIRVPIILFLNPQWCLDFCSVRPAMLCYSCV